MSIFPLEMAFLNISSIFAVPKRNSPGLDDDKRGRLGRLMPSAYKNREEICFTEELNLVC